MRRFIFIVFFLFLTVFFAFAAIRTAEDPTRINVGVRPLGLGRAYVGLSDDINAIYNNPAGLAQIDRFQATSLSGKIMDETSYFVLGLATPNKGGVWGVGFTSSNLGFTSSGSTIEGGRVVTLTGESVTASDYDSVIFLTYASKVADLLNLDWEMMQRLNYGVTLKLFSKELSSTGTGYAASGYEVDLGLLYKFNQSLQMGLLAKNALPYSMGGKIVWSSGQIEVFPAVIKAGLSLKVLGVNGLKRLGQHNLRLNVDSEYLPGYRHLPVLWHAGLEWAPVRIITLRLGLDQDYLGQGSGVVGTSNNLSAGVGLNYGGFRFDYAYHPFESTPGISNHFFSITYGIKEDWFANEEVKPIVAKPVQKRVEKEPEPVARVLEVKPSTPAKIAKVDKVSSVQTVRTIKTLKQVLSNPPITIVDVLMSAPKSLPQKLGGERKVEEQQDQKKTNSAGTPLKVVVAGLAVVGLGGLFLWLKGLLIRK